MRLSFIFFFFEILEKKELMFTGLEKMAHGKCFKVSHISLAVTAIVG